MSEILTANDIANIYGVRPQTIRTYIDGYRLAPYRVNNYTIKYNDESKLIINELLARRKRFKTSKEGKKMTQYEKLQSKISDLERNIMELIDGKRQANA